MIDNLPQWFPPFSSCGKCDTHGFIVKDGFSYKCSCRIEYDSTLSLLRKLLDANLFNENSSKDAVEFLLQASFSLYKGKDTNRNLDKIKKFCLQFKQRYAGLNLFFSGRPGTQKTTLAKTMIKELIKQGVSCYYILANDLIELIIESSRDKEKKDFLNSILIVSDFLVIDEFSADKIISFASGWQRKNFFPYIKYRLETIKKSTLFISNQTIDNIGSYFEEAIQDLVMREVPDHSMIFEDNYIQNRGKLDLSSIWDT